MKRSQRRRLAEEQNASGQGSKKDERQKLSPEALAKIAAPILAFIDRAPEHEVKSRFLQLVKERGFPPVLEAIAQSGLPEHHKTAAAKFALDEKNDGALHGILHVLDFALHDREAHLTHNAAPLAVYLTALQRREEAFPNLQDGRASAREVAARISEEQPKLIGELLLLRPQLNGLFPHYSPPKAETPKPAPKVEAQRAPAIKQVPITENGKAAPTAETVPVKKIETPVVVIAASPTLAPDDNEIPQFLPFKRDPNVRAPKRAAQGKIIDLPAFLPARKEVTTRLIPAAAPRPPAQPKAPAAAPSNGTARVYRSVQELQKGVGDLVVFRPGRSTLDARADARKAVALIDAHPQLVDDKLRNEKGVALIHAGAPQEAAAYMEKLRAHPQHAKDPFTHVISARALRAAGRAREAEALLAPLIKEGGFLHNNSHAFVAHAYSISEVDGPAKALTFLDGVVPKDSVFASQRHVMKARDNLARQAGNARRPADPTASAQGLAPTTAPGG